MRQTARKVIVSMLSSAAVIGALVLAPLPATAAEGASSVVEKGKAVAFDRKKGNCLACHMMDDGTLPGNIGPPLVSMKLRFPDKAKLRPDMGCNCCKPEQHHDPVRTHQGAQRGRN